MALSFYVVQAAWNTKVTTGQSLSQSLWNDVVDKLISLDGRIGTLEAVPPSVIACAWSGTRTICGDCSGTDDDIEVTCAGGILTSMRMSSGN